MSHRLCSYCGSAIALMRRLKGESYCSSEHAELGFRQESQRALARVVSMPSYMLPRKTAARPSTVQVQEHARPAGLNRTAAQVACEAAAPRQASLLAYPSAVIPAPPPKFTPVQPEWWSEVPSVFSGLRVPNPIPLDQFGNVDLIPAPELELLPPSAESNVLDAQPATDLAAPEPLPGTSNDRIPVERKRKRKRNRRVPRFDLARDRRFASGGQL